LSAKVFLIACALAIHAGAQPRVETKGNQIGFLPNAAKQLVWSGDSGEVHLVDLVRGGVAWSGFLSEAKVWEASGDTVRRLDFSRLQTPGLYAAYMGERRISANIEIGPTVYRDVFHASLKWFYYQRASIPLEPQYAGRWSRAAGHPDTSVAFYPPLEGVEFQLRSPQGWYDAGDYGKYIVNSGITSFTLMQLYEHFPRYMDAQKWNIPESRNRTPDLLDEVRWNLEWMATMQDRDGGVYHKLTTQRFSGAVLPAEDTAPRFVVQKTTAATLNFSAVMAQASRVYRSTDASFAKRCLAASELAFSWATRNPDVKFAQPDGMNTGQYGADGSFSDERLWAAVELYMASRSPLYKKVVDSLSFNSNGPWWGNVNFLAVYQLSLHEKEFGRAKAQAARDTLRVLADQLRAAADTSAYGVPVLDGNFVWGSNSAVANNGIVLLHAYYISGDASYLHAAQKALDYLLGRNPLGLSFVTGFGARSPRAPHHRPSEGDGIDDPLPGQLVGGPHLGKQDIGPEAWKCTDYTKSGKHALAYLDNWCSYATNEVAINWNAPLAYLLGSLLALESGAANP